MNEKVEQVALAVREEIVRQYRDDERSKCPAGAHYYEVHIAPDYIARVAIAAMRKPTEAMIKGGNFSDTELLVDGYQGMIDAALNDEVESHK